MKRRVLTSLLMLVTTLAMTHTATARELVGSGGGGVDPNGRTISVHVGTSDDGVVDVNGGSRTALVDFTVVSDGSAHAGSLGGLCNAGNKPDGSPTVGVSYHEVASSRADGRLVYDQHVCIPVTTPGQGPNPVFPQLPSVEDAWRAANLPTPAINLDPKTRGITGLDTRIWTDTPATIRIDAEAGGYTIVGTATVTGYQLTIDNDPPVTVDNAGTDDNPIDHYTFATKGVHHLRVGVIWHGTATLAGPGLLTAITTDIGDATITTTRDYQVNEIRSVLQRG